MNLFYWIVWGICFVPARLLFPTKIINKPVFRQKGRAVIACNHMSNLDPIVLKYKEHSMRYILAKHTLFKNKFLGKVFTSFGAIPVDRKAVGLSTIKTVLGILKQDRQVIIFPEGTRKISIDEANEIKNGVAMFALKGKAPIIPMAFLLQPKVFRYNKLLVGEPIDLSSYYDQKVTKELMSEIGDNVLLKIQKLRTDFIDSLPQKKKEKIQKKIDKDINKYNKKSLKKEKCVV